MTRWCYFTCVFAAGSLFVANAYAQQGAFDPAALNECYAGVEALDMEMNAGEIPHKEMMDIHRDLDRAVGACDKGDAVKGMTYLMSANKRYRELSDTIQKGKALSDSDFWRTVTYQWDNISAPGSIQLTKGQLTCDIHVDYVGWRLNTSSSKGKTLDILALSKNSEGQQQTATLSLPYDDSAYGLCSIKGDNTLPAVTIKDADHTILSEVSANDALCPHMVEIDDGMCDKLYLFWPKATTGTQVTFTLYRR